MASFMNISEAGPPVQRWRNPTPRNENGNHPGPWTRRGSHLPPRQGERTQRRITHNAHRQAHNAHKRRVTMLTPVGPTMLTIAGPTKSTKHRLTMLPSPISAMGWLREGWVKDGPNSRIEPARRSIGARSNEMLEKAPSHRMCPTYLYTATLIDA